MSIPNPNYVPPATRKETIEVWDDPINVRKTLAEIERTVILQEFENLSLEEKVDKLVKAYADWCAYGR